MADREQKRPQRTAQGEELPPSYLLDESDPDILILRRGDGTFVAAFSAAGASREGIVEAAKEDYETLLARVRTEGKSAGGEGEESDPTDSRG